MMDWGTWKLVFVYASGWIVGVGYVVVMWGIMGLGACGYRESGDGDGEMMMMMGDLIGDILV